MENIIGIAGGMGPEAGAALFNRILLHTPAAADQDHLPIILMSFPASIGDRTAFLEGAIMDNPGYSVARVVRRLESAGASIIGIACNTVYAPPILDVITCELEKAGSKVRLLHMPYETCRFIKDHHTHARRIGLMTTNGTYGSCIYENLLLEFGYQPVRPSPDLQRRVIHKMIYDSLFGIKANAGRITSEAMSLMDEAMLFFKRQNTDAVVFGCTELSMVYDRISGGDHLLIDSTTALALALIREATAENHKNSHNHNLNYL
jgi:aspartate racemase